MGGFANNAPIVTDGLVFYVDAGNGKSYDGVSGGTTWTDLVGGNDGTLTNMETDPANAGYVYDSGNGGSIVFDGVNDIVIAGPSSSMGASLSSATWSAWFKSSNTTSIGYISSLKRLPSGTASSLFSIVLNRSGASTGAASGYLLILTNDGSDFQFLSYDGNYDDGNWHNVVGVVTPTSRVLYVDGQSVANDSNGGLSNVTDNTEPITIGAFENSGSDFFLDGAVSSVAFYNRASQPQKSPKTTTHLKTDSYELQIWTKHSYRWVGVLCGCG